MKDLEGALADYSKALQLKPDAGVFYARGTVYQTKDNLNEAAADYTKVIELDPAMATAYANRAVIRTLQNRKEEARQDFETAFRLQPGLREGFKKFLERLK